MAEVYIEHKQVFPSVLTIDHSQRIGMAATIYNQLLQIIPRARVRSIQHDQTFDTATPLYIQNDQVFDGLAGLTIALNQVWRCYGPPVVIELLQKWASHDYNMVSLPLVQVIGAELDTLLQEIQFSVIIAGVRVGIVDCEFDRAGFANSAVLQLRDRGDWLNKQVGDTVVLTLFGEQYQLVVVNKPHDEQVGQGSYELGYQLECMSITCQLAEGINPDISASRVTASFPAGTWVTEILDLVTSNVCSYALNVQDFQVGAFDFDDVERYAAIREVLPEQYGWIIETDKDGVLQVSQWALPDIGGSGKKELAFGRKSLTPPAKQLYSQVEIKNYNQEDGATGLTLEVIDNGDGTGVIYGYSVPWTDAFSIFDSEDTPAPSLLIVGGAVEEAGIEDTDVEFVGYAASLSRPCYSMPVIDWGGNDSLSPVTYTESGALRTSTDPGYSVAPKVIYTTRRKKWVFDNRKALDVTQLRLKYDSAN